MITGVEIKRKIVHLATLIIPIGYALTSEETVLLFLVPFFLAFLLVDLLRHFHSGMASLFQKYFFGRVLREEEKPTLMGSTYFLFSTHPDHPPLSQIDCHCQPAHPDPL